MEYSGSKENKQADNCVPERNERVHIRVAKVEPLYKGVKRYARPLPACTALYTLCSHIRADADSVLRAAALYYIVHAVQYMYYAHVLQCEPGEKENGERCCCSGIIDADG